MTAISRFLRTTILGGAFFLMPVVVLAYLLNKAFDFARRGLKPVAKIIPDQLVSGATMGAIMAIGLIVLLCSSRDCLREPSWLRRSRPNWNPPFCPKFPPMTI
jgi:hypothetical protein